MAIYRTVQLSFWTDPKIDDEFTPEEKYFYLYLLTNPHTNICGCYEISMKQMCRETGYNEDTIGRLMKRMVSEHGVVEYSKKTKEVLIPNWHKYNWSRSKDTLKGVANVAEYIKDSAFRDKVFEKINYYSETPYTPPIDTPQTSVSVTVSVTDTDTSLYKEIIEYLNNSIGSSYRVSSTKTQGLIKARLHDGFTVDDFKTVIDKKKAEWFGTDMAKFLRPETLFGTKFESYLNQQEVKPPKPKVTDGLSFWSSVNVEE